MQLFGPSGARNVPFDRNPTTVVNGIGSTAIVGGGNTTPADYTCPAGRRATLGIGGAAAITTALAAGQMLTLFVLLTPSGGAATVAEWTQVVGVLGVGNTLRLAQARIELKAGDRVILNGALSAGAGVANVGGGLTGIEYDA